MEGEPRERETYVAKAASLRLEIGGVVELIDKAEISGTRWGGEVGVEGGGGYVESPHVLISLFGANEDECRVSGGKYRERGGCEET